MPSSQNNSTQSTYYTVEQYLNGQFMFASDEFSSRAEAEQFLSDYQTLDHSDVSYAVFKCFTRDSIVENNEHYTPDECGAECEDQCEAQCNDYGLTCDDEPYPLASMTIEDYGKGYLLRPNSDDDLFGEKYFLDGWWNNRANGWFFKKESLHYLLELGAEYISDEVNDSYVEREVSEDSNGVEVTINNYEYDEAEEEDDDDFEQDLTGMTFRKYGKGYLLKCKKSDPRYGEKYFLEGWWMPTQNGWFFKSEYKQFLRELGAKYKKSKSSKSESSNSGSSNSGSSNSGSSKSGSSNSASGSRRSTRRSVNSNVSFVKYGKGYLLVPESESHPDFGEKYYHGGWWMPCNNAWFFKKDAKKAYESSL